MLRAHRQAWAWQDEWHGLTMEDIREIERQTQLALKRKMGQDDSDIEQDASGNLLFISYSIKIIFILKTFFFSSKRNIAVGLP